MKTKSDKLKKIRPSGIRLIFDLAQKMEDVISLGLGAPDFDTPVEIKNAAKKALDEGYTSYSPNLGYLSLREAICEKYKQDYKLEYDPESEVMITCGGCEGLFNACQAFLDPGDEVIIPDPGFLTYSGQVILAGATPVGLPLKEEDEFEIDIETLKEKITLKTKMIILNFPSNPTGAVMSREKLKAVADLAIDHDLIILSDEVYEVLNYTGNEHVCMASLGTQDRTIVLNSFSKTYCMTGWRLGYLVAPKELVESLNLVHQINTACANSPAQIAAIKALKEVKSFQKSLKEEYQKRRDVIHEGLNSIENISCIKPKGAFYAFPNISQTGMSSVEFSEFLIQKAKVAVVPGDSFGPHGEGFVRVAYTVSIDKLEEALERIKQAFD
ncbi:MAG: pyridoxal phosphate-dependent aminotransferase [Candidatus Helarchaeales archaeon]